MKRLILKIALRIIRFYLVKFFKIERSFLFIENYTYIKRPTFLCLILNQDLVLMFRNFNIDDAFVMFIWNGKICHIQSNFNDLIQLTPSLDFSEIKIQHSAIDFKDYIQIIFQGFKAKAIIYTLKLNIQQLKNKNK